MCLGVPFDTAENNISFAQPLGWVSSIMPYNRNDLMKTTVEVVVTQSLQIRAQEV